MLTQDYIGLFLVYLIIGVTLSVALLLDRYDCGVDVRKIVHIGVGNFVLVWWLFGSGVTMVLFFTLPFTVLLALAMFRNNFIGRGRLGQLTYDEGHTTGLFFYVISITVMILLFFPNHWLAASIGVVAMTYGDGFGSVVGKRFGKHRMFNGKSLEGSLGVFLGTFIASLAISVLYIWLTSLGHYVGDVDPHLPVWSVCMLVGIWSAFVEALCPGEYDNLVIPISSAVISVAMGL